MSQPHPNDPTDDRLIRRHLDGELSADEHHALNERLRFDVSFRRRYIQLADLHNAMIDLLSPNQITSRTASTQTPPGRYRFFWTAMALVTAMLILVTFREINRSLQAPESTDRPLVAVSQTAESASTDKKNAADPVPAAIVVSVDAACDGNLRIGQRLVPGVVRFREGNVQLEFMSGAVISIAGPAELDIESQNGATLRSGRVSVRVPERARGFVLNGPRAAIFDLGTEFQMSVQEDGVTDVSVSDGEIELSLLGDDGNTLVSRRMREAGAVRLSGSVGEIESRPFEKDPSFPLVQKLPSPSLNVSAEYISSVVNLRPVIYWRFEEPAPEIVSSSSSGAADGIIQYGAKSDSVKVIEGHVQFMRESGLRYIRTQNAIQGLGETPLSIECWMRPDDLKHSTCIGIYPDNESPGVTHLNVIEVVTNTFLIHEPGAVRFLVRSPPGEITNYEVNAFTSGVCVPGKWQHVVAVWDQRDIRLYYNGRLERLIKVERPPSPGAFHVILGQLKPHRTERQFSGGIDEFALYQRSLSAEEIESHFRMLATLNPDSTNQLVSPASATRISTARNQMNVTHEFNNE